MGDATVAMIVVLLLFIIPAQPKTLFSTPKSVESMEQEPENKRGALLNWKYTQEKLPWDLFLIMGLFLLYSPRHNSVFLSKNNSSDLKYYLSIDILSNII